MRRPDGWYWYFGKRLARMTTMVRLWTPTTGKQQVYVRGITRCRPALRDAILSEMELEHAPPPPKTGHVSRRW